MRRFKNILYFVDNANRAEPALARALTLARQNQAKLTLLDVLEPFDIPAHFLPKDPPDLDNVVNRRVTELLYILEEFEHGDLQVDVKVCQGIPFIEVIRRVLEEDYDLLVKSPRPQSGFYKTMLGSTDLHLLRKCPCPVWIEKPGQPTPYDSILAAVDPTDTDSLDCQRLILDLGSSMAMNDGATFDVIHAWYAYGENLLGNPWLGYSESQIEDIKEKSKRDNELKLNSLLGHYGLSASHDNVHLVHGNPATSILKTCDELGSNLVVMGTTGRTGIPGFIIGNTAEDVLQNTSASILAVKPAGFISPVQL